MKKNENAKAEETKLVWKLAEKPSGHVVAELVANGVIDKEEARSILFREEIKQSDEVEALKEMVNTLQEMVRVLITRSNNVQFVPYTKVINVPASANPYWNRYWSNTAGTTTLTNSSGGEVTYTLSI